MPLRCRCHYDYATSYAHAYALMLVRDIAALMPPLMLFRHCHTPCHSEDARCFEPQRLLMLAAATLTRFTLDAAIAARC